MTRRVSVERYFAWHAWECRAERLAKEGLRRRDTAVAAKQKVDCLAVLVDGAVKIVQSRPDRNVRLIDPPRGADQFGKPAPALFKLRNIPRYPAKHGRVSNLNTTLGHHLHEIPVRHPIGDVPPHAQLDNVGVERPFPVHRVTGNRLRHSTPRGSML